MESFDYLVIGGGSAGAIVAARLAERGGLQIALFEAGPSDEGNSTILELRRWPQLLGSALDYDYVIEDNPRGNGRIRYAGGKMLGGCSSHNSCIAFIPPDEDLRRWTVDPPLIDLRYFTDSEGHDERVMVEGIKCARRIVEQPALKPWLKSELTPGKEVQTDTEISSYVRRTGNTVYHPTGTCKMGTDGTAVIDPSLRVRGITGLRIADASVFPSIATVNPNITCMMIGERCASFVLDQVNSSDPVNISAEP